MTENLPLRSLTDIATIPLAPRPVVFLLADETIDRNRQEAPTSRSCAWSAIQLGMS